MLTFLENLAAGFWNFLRRCIGLILPFFSEAREYKALGRGLRWILHVVLLVGLLGLCWWINKVTGLGKLVTLPWLQEIFLPLVVFLGYVLLWLGWWLWKLLGPEQE